MRSGTTPARVARAAALAAVSALALLAAACNLIDTRLAHDATLSRMVPGPGVQSQRFDCLLTLEFKRYPTSGDLRDVVIRFDSIALAEPVEFDWAYIATHDKLTLREGYGPGRHEAEATRPGEPPPLGRPTQVRFSLPARSTIPDAPATLYLEAELYWGGERQDVLRGSLEHMYTSAPAEASDD